MDLPCYIFNIGSKIYLDYVSKNVMISSMKHGETIKFSFEEFKSISTFLQHLEIIPAIEVFLNNCEKVTLFKCNKKNIHMSLYESKNNKPFQLVETSVIILEEREMFGIFEALDKIKRSEIFNVTENTIHEMRIADSSNSIVIPQDGSGVDEVG